MKHSPTPWTLDDCPCDIYDANDDCVHQGSMFEDIDIANADLITHRVNTYEALRGHILNAAICLQAGGSKAEALRILNGALELSKEV